MPMRNNHVGGDFHDMWVRTGLKLDYIRKTVVAEEAILATYPPVLYLDPNGGAKTVLLPPEADSVGLTFFIRNIADASENLTVQEDSSSTTIITLGQNEGVMVHCDGVTWRAFESS